MSQDTPDQPIDLAAFHARMVRSSRTLPEMYAALEEWSAVVVEENPVLVCQDGCARCCKHQVLAGEPEWALIHSWMRKNLTREHRQQITGRVRQQIDDPGNPLSRWLSMRSKSKRAFVRAVGKGFATEATRCPMLSSDNRCEIYPVRPFVCRAYGRAQLGDGSNMFCEIFLGRLRQGPQVKTEFNTMPMATLSPKYFELNEGSGADKGLYTILAAHLLRNATSTGDLANQPAPLHLEKNYPVVSRDDFPEIQAGRAGTRSTTISVVDAR